MKGQSKRQVSFLFDAQYAEELEAAGLSDGPIEFGPFCRELVKWAFSHYKRGRLFTPAQTGEG